MSVEPAAGSNPGSDCQRPAGPGSHTGEISVAISNTHIITRTAQLLTLCSGRGPCAKRQRTVGGFTFCDGCCGLWVSAIKCTLFVVALFEEVKNATLQLMQHCTMLVAPSSALP